MVGSENQDSKPTADGDVENQEQNTNGETEDEERLLPECDGLWYMGQSKKHRYRF